MPYSNTNIFSRKNKICLLNFQLNIEQLLHLIGNIIRNKKILQKNRKIRPYNNNNNSSNRKELQTNVELQTRLINCVARLK